MALPDELLDELLSAHLDGATSGDERARVEQLLNDDPAIAEHLEQLRRQRELMREAAYTTPKLPDGFADQIVQAAIRQAQADELRPDHPLRLAASGSYVSPKRESNHTNHRLIATVAGLAASVLFIGYMVKEFGFAPNNQPDKNTLVNLPKSDPEQAPSRITKDPSAPIVTPETSSTPDTMIARSEKDDSVLVESNDTDMVPSPDLTPKTSEPLLVDAGNGSPQKNVGESPETLPPNAVRVAARPLRMLMVIEINQTESGRAIGAFDQALANVNIVPANEREVDESLARAVTKNNVAHSENGNAEDHPAFEAVLLESPVTQLDNLVNLLVANREGIQGVGFSLVSVDDDASLMRSIESVRTPDPTTIRHQGQSIPIVIDSEDVLDAWINKVGDRSFAPLSEGQAGPIIGMTSGPDPMANILFLVR
ncbi:MAG: hypothetical protein KDB00_00095 [Planctomycetales bacterium]|nr:hypothetical protein [Planctomycetales bacterium]